MNSPHSRRWMQMISRADRNNWQDGDRIWLIPLLPLHTWCSYSAAPSMFRNKTEVLRRLPDIRVCPYIAIYVCAFCNINRLPQMRGGNIEEVAKRPFVRAYLRGQENIGKPIVSLSGRISLLIRFIFGWIIRLEKNILLSVQCTSPVFYPGTSLWRSISNV